MSDDEVGYKKPPKRTQFKPGESGNKRGRPRKEERHLLPRQMRKDVLQLLEKKVVVNTPSGRQKLSGMQLYLATIMRQATAGKPTAMRIWLDLSISALSDRMTENGAVQLLDGLLDLENRGRARLHDFQEEGFDLREVTKDIY